MKKLNGAGIFLLGLAIALGSGCSTMEDNYRRAQQENSIISYEKFLNAYPDSPYAQEAANKLGDLRKEKAFADAEAKNTTRAYEEFLAQHGSVNSPYCEAANRRLRETDDEAFARTCLLGTPQAFRGFAESRPGSGFAQVAIDYAEYLQVTAVGGISSYTTFIAEHPNNPFVWDARATFLPLWLGQVRGRIGVVVNMGEIVKWKGILGGKATPEKVRTKAFDDIQKQLSKHGVECVLLQGVEEVDASDTAVVLLVDCRESPGEPRKYPHYGSVYPPGTGYNAYVTQQLNQGAADNLADIVNDILFGPPANLVNTFTVKDTREGIVYYSNVAELDSRIGPSEKLTGIGFFGGKAIRALLVAVYDRDPEVRRKAAEILRGMNIRVSPMPSLHEEQRPALADEEHLTRLDARRVKGQGRSCMYEAPVETVWDKTKLAVADLGLEIVSENRQEGFILAEKGLSAFSLGETVTILVEKGDETHTKVEVISRKKMATNILARDWEKPILDKIRQLVTTK